MNDTPEIAAAARAIARFAHAMDAAPDVEELLAVVTDDVTLTLPGATPTTIAGRDALRDWVLARREAGAQGPASGTRHLVGSIDADVDGETARVRSHFLYLGTGPDGPMLRAVGTYDDELRLDGGTWRLARRRILS